MSRSAATAFSAACVIFLCGFGTVKAAEYLENVIKVQEWGFESADAATMARNETEYPRTYIVSEEVGLSMEDNDVKEVVGGEEGPVLFEAGEEDMTEEVEVEEMPVKNYSSLEEFRRNEDIIFPQPLPPTCSSAAPPCGYAVPHPCIEKRPYGILSYPVYPDLLLLTGSNL